MHLKLRQDNKANMVRDQVQTRELLLGAPAPLILEVHNVTQRLAEQAVIRQIVVRRHQCIPFTTFCKIHSGANLNLQKINASRGRSSGTFGQNKVHGPYFAKLTNECPVLNELFLRLTWNCELTENDGSVR